MAVRRDLLRVEGAHETADHDNEKRPPAQPRLNPDVTAGVGLGGLRDTTAAADAVADRRTGVGGGHLIVVRRRRALDGDLSSGKQ